MFLTYNNPNNIPSSQSVYNSSCYSNQMIKQQSFYLQPIKQNLENSMNLIPQNLANNLITDQNNTNLIKHLEKNAQMLIDCNNDFKNIIEKYNDKLIQTDLSLQKIQKEFEKYENIMINIIDNLKIQFDILTKNNTNENDLNHYSNNYINSLDKIIDQMKNDFIQLMKKKEEECYSNLKGITIECEELKIYFMIELKKIMDYLKNLNNINKEELNYEINSKIENIILKLNKLKNELVFVNYNNEEKEKKNEEISIDHNINNESYDYKNEKLKYFRIKKNKGIKFVKRKYYDL